MLVDDMILVEGTPAAAPPVQVPVDASDPIAAIVGWLLASALRRYLGDRASAYRSLIPIVSILIAVALRAGYGAALGESFTTATMLRAVAAGAVAVAGHSQFREAVKLSTERKVRRAKRVPRMVAPVPEAKGRPIEPAPEPPRS